MVIRRSNPSLVTALAIIAAILGFAAPAAAQAPGTIRGVVLDADFETPVAGATVTIASTGASMTTEGDGSYVFGNLPPGTYALTFAKPGFATQSRPGIAVNAGGVTEVDIELTGAFTDLEDFQVQDLDIGAGDEAGLQQLRLDAPALENAISAEQLSRAGASDAAAALNLVSGATVQDGKFAVVRGLPDRFVNSQLSGVRLPTADADKRAVELDQFPSSVIESVRVAKTFTPDQQGDASGGAVNVVLKGIPDETFVKFSGQVGFNSNVLDRTDFLTSERGGVNFFGDQRGEFDQPEDPTDQSQYGSVVGVSRGRAEPDSKWNVSAGGVFDLDDDVRIGAFMSIFYERESSFVDDGIDDSLWVLSPGEGLTPVTSGDNPTPTSDFKTSLFDVQRGSQEVQWGALGKIGVEVTDAHQVSLAYLYTRSAEDQAILAEDTRGKEFYNQLYFGVAYDPDDPMNPGNFNGDAASVAPYLRTETLEYTERTTETWIIDGRHELPVDDFGFENRLMFKAPVIDWIVAQSVARSFQPDKVQFGSQWLAPQFRPGIPAFGIPDRITDPVHGIFKPANVFALGNVQRIWEDIIERSEQVHVNVTLPFEQWSGTPGSFKTGIFRDEVVRTFEQDSYSNLGENALNFIGDFETLWSGIFPSQDFQPFGQPDPGIDVNYRGDQRIEAWYLMGDVPMNEEFKLIGGVRFERTSLDIVNDPDPGATYYPGSGPVFVALAPGVADVAFDQEDLLPSIGLAWTPNDQITFRAAYTETIARQTFKELTPIQQQEFLGADIFVGNPDLLPASVRNFDLRMDYTPYPGGLVSVSYFNKDLRNSIETVQRFIPGLSFTTPINFPEAELTGWEFEIRTDLGAFNEKLEGLTLGGNATVIDSNVLLPEAESALFSDPAILVPTTSRDVTDAPEFLYNLFATYDIEATGTQLALFYTVRGDTLVAGAGIAEQNFVPDVYATEFDTLNFTVTQAIGPYVKLKFSAKNLTDPLIEEVYRSPVIGPDVTRRAFTRGVDYSISLSAEIPF